MIIISRKHFDGGATEANGRASAPVGPSVAMPLYAHSYICYQKPGETEVVKII